MAYEPILKCPVERDLTPTDCRTVVTATVKTTLDDAASNTRHFARVLHLNGLSDPKSVTYLVGFHIDNSVAKRGI